MSGIDLIVPANDMDMFEVFVNTVMNLWVMVYVRVTKVEKLIPVL